MPRPSKARVAARWLRRAAEGHRLLRNVSPDSFTELQITAAYDTTAGERWHHNLMRMNPAALDNSAQWTDATLSRFADNVKRAKGTHITKVKVYGRTLDGKLIEVIQWSRDDGFSTDRESERELARLDREREQAKIEEARRQRELALSGDGKGYTITRDTQWENDELDVDDNDWDNPGPAVGDDTSTSRKKSLKEVWKAIGGGGYHLTKLYPDRLYLQRDYDRRYNARGIYDLRRTYVEEVTMRRSDGKPFSEVERAYITDNWSV